MSILEIKNIKKSFGEDLEVLQDISLAVEEGEVVSILGPSGSGKSTLMNIIGALDRPTSGEYMLDGVDIGKAKDKRLSEIRNQQIGFVFQTYNLIARTTALANVELPMLYAGMPKRERTSRAEELLQLVGMGDRMTHHSDELSGGQKQRVAIARAVANNPSIILADEPTGALDYVTGKAILKLLQDTCRKKGVTVVVITHNQAITAMADRIITVKNGTVTDMRKNEHIVPVEQIEW